MRKQYTQTASMSLIQSRVVKAGSGNTNDYQSFPLFTPPVTTVNAHSWPAASLSRASFNTGDQEDWVKSNKPKLLPYRIQIQFQPPTSHAVGNPTRRNAISFGVVCSCFVLLTSQLYLFRLWQEDPHITNRTLASSAKLWRGPYYRPDLDFPNSTYSFHPELNYPTTNCGEVNIFL